MSSAHGPTIPRRAVIVGAVSLPLSGAAGPVAATAPSEIEELGQRLERLTRRCKRLHARKLELGDHCARIGSERDVPPSLADGRRNPRYDDLLCELGYDTGWKEWSDQVAAAQSVAATIRRTPAISTGDLEVKFRALLWELFHDQTAEAADHEQLRLLGGFGRELSRVTSEMASPSGRTNGSHRS